MKPSGIEACIFISLQTLAGLGLIIQFSRSDTPHLIGLLWKNDQPAPETSTTTNTPKIQIYMLLAVFEPTIPHRERL
jgi:hypothetical protein